ncbi:MAG TPA: IS4 family transposase [Polyangia bacterium]
MGKKQLQERDLMRWRLVERFREELAAVAGPEHGTWTDPRRKLQLEQYLSLFLFGLFNPVVESLRGLCAASGLGRVQREVCGQSVSLGSFSEAQAVVEPALLEPVFARLQAQLPVAAGSQVVIDSTVWPVLPRMTWAFWRRQNGLGNAVRLHVQFDLARGSVGRAQLTPAKICERAQWRRWAQPGTCYIGDRYYSYDYQLLGELQQRGVDFLVRLRTDAQWANESESELSAQDRAAGVIQAGLVRLGKAGEGPRVRVVQILGEEETILLATTLPADQAPPESLALLYRHRWQVELFFRWFKCILGCRRWLAESPRGVALQCYLALIAAQLLLLHTGRRPTKRQMEAIQFYLLGWCSAQELAERAGPAPAKTT